MSPRAPEPQDLFISDLHLDADTAAHRRALAALVARHVTSATRLFIVGDLFNVWIGRRQMRDPDVREVMATVRRAADRGAEVHFIAGNRDFYGLSRLGATSGMATHRSGLTVDSLGQKVWVCHGHELYARDRDTHAAQKITHARAVEWLFQALPRQVAMFLARGYKSHSSRVVVQKDTRDLSLSDESLVERFEAGHAAIVCGHTHRLAHVAYRWRRTDDTEPREAHLWNLGSWDQSGPHFLRHAGDGWHFHRIEA